MLHPAEAVCGCSSHERIRVLEKPGQTLRSRSTADRAQQIRGGGSHADFLRSGMAKRRRQKPRLGERLGHPKSGFSGQSGVGLKKGGEWIGYGGSHSQQRILHGEAGLRCGISQHREHDRDDARGRLSSRPLSGLSAHRGIGIGEQLLYQWIGHIHARKDSSPAKATRPEPALAQFSSAIEQRNFARDEAQSLLPRSSQIAGRLEERRDLCIARYPAECIDFLNVDRATREKAGERVPRGRHIPKKLLLSYEEPDAVREKKSHRQNQQRDLDHHHEVEEIAVYHYCPCLSTVRTLCIRTGTLKGLAM